jgi:hypothetical protein
VPQSERSSRDPRKDASSVSRQPRGRKDGGDAVAEDGSGEVGAGCADWAGRPVGARWPAAGLLAPPGTNAHATSPTTTAAAISVKTSRALMQRHPSCALSPWPALPPGAVSRFASSPPSLRLMVHNSLVPRHQSGEPDPANQLGDGLDLLAALITVGLLVLTHAGRSGIPRTLLTIGFACYVPGRAIVSNWPLMARWSQAAISIIFSLAVLGLAATITLWAHYWHPVGLFQVEAVLCLAALCLGTVRRHGGTAWLASRVGRPESTVSKTTQPGR